MQRTISVSGVLGPKRTLTSYTSFDADLDAESNTDKYFSEFDCPFANLTILKILIKFAIQRLRLFKRPFFSE